jgi:hypothetical protein
MYPSKNKKQDKDCSDKRANTNQVDGADDERRDVTPPPESQRGLNSLFALVPRALLE